MKIVSIRIETASEIDRKILRVAGKLCSTDVPELERAVSAAGGSLVLDLTDLRGADVEGARALNGLRAGGVRLRGVSRYLELLLNQGELSS